MTPSKVELFDKHSLNHKKWLTRIKYADFGRPIYAIWLTDTSDNDSDKMLTKLNGQIIAAKNPTTLINHILTTKDKLFDSRQTKAWARKVRDIKPKKIAASYDLDLINSLTKKIDQGELEEVSNSINLFTDLITPQRRTDWND